MYSIDRNKMSTKSTVGIVFLIFFLLIVLGIGAMWVLSFATIEIERTVTTPEITWEFTVAN